MPRLIKVIALFLLVILGASCASRRPAGVMQAPTAKRHIHQYPQIIFFIHGFRDSGTAFKEFPELVDAKYKSANVRVKRLTYPSIISGSREVQNLNAYDFAKIINTMIISYFVNEAHHDAEDPEFSYANPVDLSTSYSLVAHSQGGLVSMNFFNSCFLSIKEIKNRVKKRCAYEDGLRILERLGLEELIEKERLREHLEEKIAAETPFGARHFVTLGTPFWGSAIANSAQNKGWILDYMRDDMPEVQLQNLAIGSRTTSLARTWMLDRYADAPEADWSEKTKWRSRYPPGLRVWNVAGALGSLLENDPSWSLTKLALSRTVWPSYYEHDLAVSAPEARADFLYFLENSDPRKPGLRGRTNFTSEYIPLKLAHMEILGYPDVAGVTSKTVDTHPSMRIVDQIINGKFGPTGMQWTPEEKDRYYVEKLANFTSEIKLITPVGYNRRFKVDPKFVKVTAQEDKAFEMIRLPNATGVWAEAQNPFALRLKHHFYQTYYHIGRFADAYALFPKKQKIEDHFKVRPNGYELNYEITIPGFKTKKFTTRVMPTFTTYSEVYIQPDLPVPAVSPKSGMLTALPVYNENWRVLRIKNGELLSDEKKSTDLLPEEVAAKGRCTVGFAAEAGVNETDRSNYISSKADPAFPLLRPHLLINLTDIANTTTEIADTGEEFEILGRVATGFRDPTSGVHRRCVLNDRRGSVEICDEPAFDRYLVTSRQIRKRDGVRYAFQVAPGSGLRWIDVMAVDIPELYPYKTIDSALKQMPRHTCLLDDTTQRYLDPRQYRKLFFLGDVD